MDYGISEEFTQLQKLTRDFVEKELRPHEEAVERSDHLPAELRAQLRKKALEVGLYGYNMPEEVGGPGLTWFAQVLIREQLGRIAIALADMVGRPPKAFLSCQGAQRERFLMPVLRAEKTWAFALTEPGAGSDAASIKTRATRSDGGWRLNGTKHFISHGDFADLVIVIAKTADDNLPLALIVEHDTPGFKLGRIHPKMGWRGYPVAELLFEDAFVPEAHVLGNPGQGLRIGLSQIGEARIGVAAHCVGMAQRALDYVLEHVKVRRQFGQPLGKFQGLQWMLADMALEIEQSRALLYAAARSMDSIGESNARTVISMAKLSASEMLGRVADRAVQIMGGAGYMAESPIEMIYRDARAFRIGEGTSEIQKSQIARAILGKDMFI